MLNINKEKIMTINKKTKTVIIIIAVCVIAVVIASVWNVISPTNLPSNLQNNTPIGEESGFPASIIGSSIMKENVKLWGNTFSYVSDTSLISLNNSGIKLIDRQNSYSTPVLEIGGDYALHYNLGGTGYKIHTSKSVVYENNTEDIIYDAKINDSGTYGLLTKSQDYLTNLEVFDNQNNKVYAYYFSVDYASVFAINEDSNKATVACINSEDGILKSTLYILDFHEEEPLKIIELEENLILEIAYFDNGNIVAVGDKELILIDSNLEITKINYDQRELISYEIDKYNGIAISTNSTKDKESKIIYISEDIIKNEELVVDYKVSDISLDGNRVALLSNDVIYLYDKSNYLVNTVQSGEGTKAICLDNENSAYILGTNELRYITF